MSTDAINRHSCVKHLHVTATVNFDSCHDSIGLANVILALHSEVHVMCLFLNFYSLFDVYGAAVMFGDLLVAFFWAVQPAETPPLV